MLHWTTSLISFNTAGIVIIRVSSICLYLGMYLLAHGRQQDLDKHIWQVSLLTSCNAIVRHFVRRAINSAQSPIGRNIAVIRHRYAICVVDINAKHVHRQYPSSQPELSGTARCILELLCVSNNETYLPGFTKSEVDTMINALCTC